MKKLINWKNQIKSLGLAGALFFGSLFVAGVASANTIAPSVPTFTNVATSSVVVNWTHTTDSSSTQMLVLVSASGGPFNQYATTSVFATNTTVIDPNPPDPNLQLTFEIVASDDAGTFTATGTPSTVYFLAETPNPLVVSASTTSALGVAFKLTSPTTTNNNTPSTTYAIYNSTSGNFLTSAGAATTTAVFQASSSWSGCQGYTGCSW